MSGAEFDLLRLLAQHAGEVLSRDADELTILNRGDPLVFTEMMGSKSVWMHVSGTHWVVNIIPHEHFLEPYPTDILIAGIGALTVIGLFGVLLVVPVVSRLRTLEKTAAALGNGDWDKRAEDDRYDAVGDLGRALNKMADQIQQLVRDQQELLQAVAHELRAPLSRLGFALEIANYMDEESERMEALETIGESAEDLNTLLAEVLGYARLQPGTPVLELASVTLEPIIHEVIDQQREFNSEIEYTSDAPSTPTQCDLDPMYFQRALLNLVSNATRHARKQVKVAWQCDGPMLTVTIDDDGLGIPPYQRERVFEAFTRLDPSRSRDSGGSGLGLAIARRISHKHNGEVSVAYSPIGRCTVRVELASVRKVH